MDEEKYYLIDLQRCIDSGIVYYWRQNKHDYTVNLSRAGRFSLKEAAQQTAADYNNMTIAVNEKKFKGGLK